MVPLILGNFVDGFMGHVPFTFLKPRTKGPVTSLPSQSSPIRMKWMNFGVRIIKVSKRCLQKKITSFLSVISHVTYIMLLLQVQPSKSHGIGYCSATSTIFSSRQFSSKILLLLTVCWGLTKLFLCIFFFFSFGRLKPTQVIIWHMDPTSIANIAHHCANHPHLIKQDTSMVRSI